MGGQFDTYRGVVLDTADPLANDRVLVEVPDVLAAESMWARPEHPGAVQPATGDAVSIRFENGDPDYPIWSADASAATAPGDSPAASEGYRATYRGIVLDNVDPGGYQRVLVEVPDVFAASSIWAMPEQADATVPEIGAEIWIRFTDGDPQHPTWSA
jgi:Type VI secretion system/phage-baseplate injector OB domain